MRRGFIGIFGADRSGLLHAVTSLLVEVANDADDELNVILDGGHGIGSFMTMGLLVETMTSRGLEAVQRAALNTIGARPGKACYGCKAMFMHLDESENGSPARVEPRSVVSVSLHSVDKPEVLSRLADFFAENKLSVLTHRGRHLNDNCYVADFSLTQAGFTLVENWHRVIDDLKRMGFTIRSFRIEFNPDFAETMPPRSEDFAPVGG